MPPLHELQESFQSFLLGEHAAIETQIIGTARAPAAARLGVYSNAYVSRLIEALESTFSALAKLLGTADFAALCESYIRAYPSSCFSLRYYGETLADFLMSHPDYESAPMLAELARWERLMTDVFDAADQTPIGFDALSAVRPERWADLRFAWHPSIRRIALLWNAPQVWSALEKETDQPDFSVSAEPVEWLAWRKELTSQYRSLSPCEAAALDTMRGGGSFGELCELLCDYVAEHEAPERAAAYLREWLGSGLIVSLHHFTL